MHSLHPPQIGIAIVCDNFSPHLSARKDKRVGQWAAASNAKIACTPTNASWINRLECHFTALREFALNGTDHATHREQNSIIRATSPGGTVTPPIPAFLASSNRQPRPDTALAN